MSVIKSKGSKRAPIFFKDVSKYPVVVLDGTLFETFFEIRLRSKNLICYEKIMKFRLASIKSSSSLDIVVALKLENLKRKYQ